MSETRTTFAPALECIKALQQTPAANGEYNLSLGYLRAFVTVLVVAHHAFLAYHPFAPAPAASLVAEPRWWGAFPVVDSERSVLFALFTGFNDIYFMSLMFFLSGLFVFQSLQRKGGGRFITDRLLRLGVPFVVAAALLAPLAYYPAFLQTGAPGGFNEFLRQWLSLGGWPAGPAWFIWVLLAFDAIAVLAFLALRRRSVGPPAFVSGSPARFFGILVVASAAAYIPLTLVFSPFHWTVAGPFTFQTSRILHYLVYFTMGAVVGAYGLGAGLLAQHGQLTRRWRRWAVAAVLSFIFASAVFIITSNPQATSIYWAALGALGFSLSCAASSLALLAFFLRFARCQAPAFDSLNRSAYGIYLVHYAFVNWLQYAMLNAPLPAISKGILVFFVGLMLSWGAVILLRRIPAVARVI